MDQFTSSGDATTVSDQHHNAHLEGSPAVSQKETPNQRVNERLDDVFDALKKSDEDLLLAAGELMNAIPADFAILDQSTKARLKSVTITLRDRSESIPEQATAQGETMPSALGGYVNTLIDTYFPDLKTMAA